MYVLDLANRIHAVERGINPPTYRLSTLALSVLVAIAGQGCGMPSVSGGGDGSLHAEWANGGNRIEIIFTPDAKTAWVWIDRKGIEVEHGVSIKDGEGVLRLSQMVVYGLKAAG